MVTSVHLALCITHSTSHILSTMALTDEAGQSEDLARLMTDPRARRAYAHKHADSLGIDYSRLPQRPFFAPLFGKTYDWYRDHIAETVIFASVALKRGLSPEEREALAQIAAKKCRTLCYEPPVSLAVTYAVWRRGYNEFRFPLYTPKSTWFDPEVFPHKKYPLYRGKVATYAWHAHRALAYYIVVHVLMSGLFESYATTVQVADTARDPRMANLRKEMAERAQEFRKRAGLPGPSQPTGGPLHDSSTPDDQSGSQYGGSQYGGSQYGGPTGNENSGFDSPDNPGAAYQRPAPSPSPRRQPPPAQTPAASSSDDIGGGDFFDDASPVARSEQRARSAGSSSQAGVTSWAELRRQAQLGQSAGQDGSGDGQSSSWSRAGQKSEEYSYSKADEEKHLAKEQAQKEFDAMLERERHAESDQNRKWR